MATRLKNLRIKKVDFVDEGANPDAHIMLYKNRDAGGKPAEKRDEGNANILKRLISAIAKTLGVKESQLDDVIEKVKKGDSESFDERYVEVKNRKIADEIWDVCFALQSSLCSILNDDELDATQTSTAMTESLDEFYEVVKDAITQWSNGKANCIVRKNEITETELEIMKSAQERLAASIEKSVVIEEDKNIEKSKGDEEMALVNVDKNKLTAAERAFLEDIEKRCGTETTEKKKEENEEEEKKEKEKEDEKKPLVTKSSSNSEGDYDSDDIYKGLHPAVKAEMEELKKFREATEERELGQVAKKYEIIGKKPEELVPLFKSLRATGGTAYDDMIAVLDQAVETVEKSGAFSEIGKSGHDSSTTGAVEAKIETIAKGYMEKDSSLNYTAAVAKAWEDNPELIGEYEEKAGF